ncbi:MAG TPA: hypothetical protein VK993_01715 [Chthoniobacterales bacterium]|nr:hypothetical protein [Chthoniobacterales bacterium]
MAATESTGEAHRERDNHMQARSRNEEVVGQKKVGAKKSTISKRMRIEHQTSQPRTGVPRRQNTPNVPTHKPTAALNLTA